MKHGEKKTSVKNFKTNQTNTNFRGGLFQNKTPIMSK